MEKVGGARVGVVIVIGDWQGKGAAPEDHAQVDNWPLTEAGWPDRPCGCPDCAGVSSWALEEDVFQGLCRLVADSALFVVQDLFPELPDFERVM